jgi:hypothetical protein
LLLPQFPPFLYPCLLLLPPLLLRLLIAPLPL